MAARFKAKSIIPGLIICSPALRTRKTLEFFVRALDYDEARIVLDRLIYECNSRDISDYLAALTDDLDSVLLVGHNPCLSSMASYFTSLQFGEMPTCSIACIDFDIESWRDIFKKSGKLRFFDYPKAENNS
jgi:phosphohistidine phosphatase